MSRVRNQEQRVLFDMWLEYRGIDGKIQGAHVETLYARPLYLSERERGEEGVFRGPLIRVISSIVVKRVMTSWCFVIMRC